MTKKAAGEAVVTRCTAWGRYAVSGRRFSQSLDTIESVWGTIEFGVPLMDLDDELCLCFHVSQRKVVNYLRVEKPRRAGQLSECFGAGTGCGWCRPFLEKLFEQAAAGGVLI